MQLKIRKYCKQHINGVMEWGSFHKALPGCLEWVILQGILGITRSVGTSAYFYQCHAIGLMGCKVVLFSVPIQKLYDTSPNDLNNAIDTNTRNGSAPNLLSQNKFRAMKYEYLVTLVVVKNAEVVQSIQWQKLTTDREISFIWGYNPCMINSRATQARPCLQSVYPESQD